MKRVIRLPASQFSVKIKKRGMPRYDGLVFVGEEDNEIWINDRLSKAERSYTTIHELVHARRQFSNEECEQDEMEELIVELETVARADEHVLGGLFLRTIVWALKSYLTNGGKDSPNISKGLRKIYTRINRLKRLLNKEGKQ